MLKKAKDLLIFNFNSIAYVTKTLWKLDRTVFIYIAILNIIYSLRPFIMVLLPTLLLYNVEKANYVVAILWVSIFCYYRFSLSKINRYLLSTDYRNCCRLRAFVVLSRHSFFLHPRYWCCKFYENSHSRTSFTAWSSMIRFFVWLPYSSRLVHTLSITLAVPALY